MRTSFVSLHSSVPDRVQPVSTQHGARHGEGTAQSLPRNLPRASLLPPSPSPRRAASPAGHQGPLPRPTPELAPLGEESGDQLSQLRYHPPPGRRGPALSPRGALSASCPGGPWLHPSPPELLSLGKSESAGDLVGGCRSGRWGRAGAAVEGQSTTAEGPVVASSLRHRHGLPRPRDHSALTRHPVWPCFLCLAEAKDQI